jgi:hypothetical protein
MIYDFYQKLIPQKRAPMKAEIKYCPDLYRGTGIMSPDHLEIGNKDYGYLRIDLDRTIRVEDNGKPNIKLPHIKTHVNMNMYRNFPLYNVAEFEDVLPKHIVEKGGVFLLCIVSVIPNVSAIFLPTGNGREGGCVHEIFLR